MFPTNNHNIHHPAPPPAAAPAPAPVPDNTYYAAGSLPEHHPYSHYTPHLHIQTHLPLPSSLSPSSAEQGPPSSVIDDDQEPQYTAYNVPERNHHPPSPPDHWQAAYSSDLSGASQYYPDPYPHVHPNFSSHAPDPAFAVHHEDPHAQPPNFTHPHYQPAESYHTPHTYNHPVADQHYQEHPQHYQDHAQQFQDHAEQYDQSHEPDPQYQEYVPDAVYHYGWSNSQYDSAPCVASPVEQEQPLEQPRPAEQPMFSLERPSHDYIENQPHTPEQPPPQLEDRQHHPQPHVDLSWSQHHQRPVPASQAQHSPLPVSPPHQQSPHALHLPPSPQVLRTPSSPVAPVPAPAPARQSAPPPPLSPIRRSSPIPRLSQRRSPTHLPGSRSRSASASPPVPIVPSQAHMRPAIRSFHPYPRPPAPPAPVFGLFGSYPLSRGPRELPPPGPTCAPASCSSVMRLVLAPPFKRPPPPLPPPPQAPPQNRRPRMACFFCRKRKIACGPGPAAIRTANGGKDMSFFEDDGPCNQCARRGLECERPTESKRGVRKGKPKEPSPVEKADSSHGSVASGSNVTLDMMGAREDYDADADQDDDDDDDGEDDDENNAGHPRTFFKQE